MEDWSSMSEEDKKWKGRSDARTLAEAETIKADKVRYANAIPCGPDEPGVLLNPNSFI